MRKYNWLNKVSIITLMISLLFTPFTTSAATSTDAAIYDEVKGLISKYHVSGTSADFLTANTIDGIIKQLNDPYTVYLKKEDANKFKGAVNNNYVGIGIRVSDNINGVYVEEIFKGNPADIAGIKIGDIFYSINGVSAKGKKAEELVNEIKGPIDSTVEIIILRAGKKISFTLKRKTIELPVVTSFIFNDGNAGYINIASFSEELKSEVSKKLSLLEKNNIKSLIIDLRNNGGGYVESAKDLLEFFSVEGDAYYSKDRDGNIHVTKYSNGKKVDYRLFVLVNEYSASASEIFTGAIQDNKIGIAIGTKTFGKGTIQALVPLSNGDTLKLTFEEYFTPKNRKVHGVGLLPDIVVQGNIPQLLTALNQANVNPIHLQFNEKSTVISGFTVNESVVSINRNGISYIPSRVAAALVGRTITWNATKGILSLKSVTKNSTFTTTTKSVILDKGTTYISLTALKSAFPKLTFSSNGKVVSVSYTKG